MNHIELSLSIYKSNINSLITIYNDSKEISLKRAQEVQRKSFSEPLTDDLFKQLAFYLSHFDWLLLQSLFISGFTYYENYMKGIAEKIQEIKGDKIKLNDIKGDGYLDTYRKYIFLIGDIQKANSGRMEWQTILEYKTIRNAIIHEDGAIIKKLNKIKAVNIYFGQGEKHIRIRNIQFLEDFVKTSIEYMESIALEATRKITGLTSFEPFFSEDVL